MRQHIIDKTPHTDRGQEFWIADAKVTVAVFKHKGQFFAVNDECPHAGGNRTTLAHAHTHTRISLTPCTYYHTHTTNTTRTNTVGMFTPQTNILDLIILSLYTTHTTYTNICSTPPHHIICNHKENTFANINSTRTSITTKSACRTFVFFITLTCMYLLFSVICRAVVNRRH